MTPYSASIPNTANKSVAIIGLLSLAIYITFSLLSHLDNRFSITSFLLGAFALVCGSVFLFHQSRQGRLDIGWKQLIFWAIAFRVCGIAGAPLYEDDFYRYLWDGFLFSTLGNPYGIAPFTFFDDITLPENMQFILGQINYPDIATIYGPTLQYSFLFANWIDNGSVTVLQIIYSLADLALVGILLKLTHARNVLLYAWNPLVIKEIAFTAHPDGLGVLLMFIGLLAYVKKFHHIAAMALALSIGAKIFALLIAPLILLRMHWSTWVTFSTTLLLLYAPFLLNSSTDGEGLSAFAQSWEFNSAAYGIATQFLSPMVAKVILGLCFVVGYSLYAYRFWKRRSESYIPRGDLLFGFFLLISPVINPWYLLWLLPFATLFPSLWAWGASFLVMLSYCVGLNLDSAHLEAYETAVWVRPLEFGGLLLLVLIGIQRHRKTNAEPKSVSFTHDKNILGAE